MQTAMPAARFAFDALTPQPPDALLSLIKLYADDPRPEKIDLGVGVYRTVDGRTPVFASVKAAEQRLINEQSTKSYLGPEGDLGFLEKIKPIVFGPGSTATEIVGVQTPGGTGALRLAAELLAAGRPEARIWLGSPTWPNHAAIFEMAGLTVVDYPYFDSRTQSIRFGEMLSALDNAASGDAVLLHGCCHNPTGADPDLEQWRVLAERIAARGLVPLIDFAYQGLGAGLDADAAGARLIIQACDNALVAYSLDKNFGLYRERVGALFARSPSHGELVQSNILRLARGAWSMPPDHGAAVVRVILEDTGLTRDWHHELEGMRNRLVEVRAALAAAAPAYAGLAKHHGMFALLPLSADEILRLRMDHGVYMAGSGRINLAGLNSGNVRIFAEALTIVCRDSSSDHD